MFIFVVYGNFKFGHAVPICITKNNSVNPSSHRLLKSREDKQITRWVPFWDSTYYSISQAKTQTSCWAGMQSSLTLDVGTSSALKSGHSGCKLPIWPAEGGWVRVWMSQNVGRRQFSAKPMILEDAWRRLCLYISGHFHSRRPIHRGLYC